MEALHYAVISSLLLGPNILLCSKPFSSMLSVPGCGIVNTAKAWGLLTLLRRRELFSSTDDE